VTCSNKNVIMIYNLRLIIEVEYVMIFFLSTFLHKVKCQFRHSSNWSSNHTYPAYLFHLSAPMPNCSQDYQYFTSSFYASILSPKDYKAKLLLKKILLKTILYEKASCIILKIKTQCQHQHSHKKPKGKFTLAIFTRILHFFICMSSFYQTV